MIPLINYRLLTRTPGSAPITLANSDVSYLGAVGVALPLHRQHTPGGIQKKTDKRTAQLTLFNVNTLSSLCHRNRNTIILSYLKHFHSKEQNQEQNHEQKHFHFSLISDYR